MSPYLNWTSSVTCSRERSSTSLEVLPPFLRVLCIHARRISVHLPFFQVFEILSSASDPKFSLGKRKPLILVGASFIFSIHLKLRAWSSSDCLPLFISLASLFNNSVEPPLTITLQANRYRKSVSKQTGVEKWNGCILYLFKENANIFFISLQCPCVLRCRNALKAFFEGSQSCLGSKQALPALTCPNWQRFSPLQCLCRLQTCVRKQEIGGQSSWKQRLLSWC